MKTRAAIGLMVVVMLAGCTQLMPDPPPLEMEIGYLDPEATGHRVTLGVFIRGGAEPIGCRCEVGDGSGAEIALKYVEMTPSGRERWEGAYVYHSWGEYTATCMARDMSGQTVTDDILFRTYDNGVVCWYIPGGIPGFPHLTWHCSFEGWGMELP